MVTTKFRVAFLGMLLLAPTLVSAETIDITIKGVDDGVRSNKQQDYKEALMNAKLQAIERAGSEIESIVRIVNFQVKFQQVETKAKAVLLPGFQVIRISSQILYIPALDPPPQLGTHEFRRSSIVFH